MKYIDEVASNGGKSQKQSIKMCKCRVIAADGLFSWCFVCISLCFLLSVFTVTHAASCAGLEVPFLILPPGDRVIKHGDAMEIFCMLEKDHPSAANKTARDLSFYHAINSKREKLSSEFVSVYNETTIRLYIKEPPAGKEHYYCELDDRFCLNTVIVGYPPSNVKNLSCVSMNWENLTCRWDPPENPLKTTYKFFLILPGRAGRLPKHCPSNQDEFNNTCFFSLKTDPLYRQSHESFTFRINGTNALGNNSQKQHFGHFEHVIPAPPENVTILNRTSHSVLIFWEVPVSMQNFPPGLVHRIEYQSVFDETKYWKSANTAILDTKSKNHTFNLTDLQYANAYYEIKIYMKSAKAKNENMWSAAHTVCIRTLPERPAKSPTATIGSFSITMVCEKRDIYLYWHKLQPYEMNGQDFSYKVTCIQKGNIPCDGNLTNLTDSYARYTGLGNGSYTFTIYSVNEIGHSLAPTTIMVPSSSEIAPEPEVFTVVPFDAKFYELSWKRVHHRDLTNYTIYWCEVDKLLTCKAFFDWEYVSANNTLANITITEKETSGSYRFAIASNFRNGSSSGLTWASCFLSPSNGLEEVQNFQIADIGSRKANISWRLRCSDNNSIIRGFFIYYCPIVGPTESGETHCREPEESIEITESKTGKATLMSLKPYTSYMVKMSIIGRNGAGKKSKPQYFSTIEDAPEPPTNLTTVSVDWNSVTVRWKLPRNLNGLLQTYHMTFVREDNSSYTTTFDAKEKEGADVYQLRHLNGSEVYNISLRACTGSSNSKCSTPSPVLTVKTLVGHPNQIMHLSAHLVNWTHANVTWNPPSIPAGSLDLYQIRLRYLDGNVEYNRTENITSDSTTSAIISVPDCNGKHRSIYFFYIRAINKVKLINKPGPWSSPVETSCITAGWSRFGVVMLWITGIVCFIFISFVMTYLIKRGWLRCKKMQDVEIKLPPGLASLETENTSGGEDPMTLNPWPPKKHTEVFHGKNRTINTCLGSDEESLLKPKNEDNLDVNPINGAANGDSSGCSVGRESLSSSITSATHISSDSGAEADSCVASTGEGLMEAWEQSSLRQRNVGVKDRSVPSPHLFHDPLIQLNTSDNDNEWLPIEAVPFEETGYTRVGCNSDESTSEKSVPGKGYVSLANMPASTVSPQTNSRSFHKLPVSSGDNILTRSTIPHVQNKKADTTSMYVTLANLQSGSNSSSSSSCNRLETIINGPNGSFSNMDNKKASKEEVDGESKSRPIAVYVSMVEYPIGDVDSGDDSSPDESQSTPNSHSTTDSNLTLNKEKTFNNYLPHHVFGQESIQT